MQLFLAEPFQSLWRDKDPFDEAFALGGDIVRDMGDRTTRRFEINGDGYYVKTHSGVGVLEIVKNLLYLRKPVLGARNEYLAIARLKQLGVQTMTAVAFGERGSNPASQESFLITRAIEPSESLADVIDPSVLSAMGVSARRALVRRLATITRTLHDNGVNHRDYYLVHFLLDTSDAASGVPFAERDISLIDLHRVQLRTRTPRRWRRKDLAGLWYSAQLVGFDYRDALVFLQTYKQQPLCQIMQESPRFWRAIDRDAEALHAKGVRKGYHA